MRISIVTNAFNQGRFLVEAIESVLSQSYADVEYFVVDPGSTDETAEVMGRYRDRIIAISEPDQGAADGLNKAFARSSGDVFGYLNADDFFLPGAFQEAADVLAGSPEFDAVCGHTWIVDAEGNRLRKSHSDRVVLHRIAHGAAVQMQPSTFIRAEAFRKVGGYNVSNRCSWDGELVVDMALAGSRFKIVDKFWSAYRVHEDSITGSMKLDEMIRASSAQRFRTIMGREPRFYDPLMRYLFLCAKYSETPAALYERLFKGPVYGRAAPKNES